MRGHSPLPLQSSLPVLACLLVLAATHMQMHVNANECGALGFSDALVCGDCTKLDAAVKDEQLTKECNSCCTSENAAAEQAPYVSGVLTACS